jgi:hypothetical protein
MQEWPIGPREGYLSFAKSELKVTSLVVCLDANTGSQFPGDEGEFPSRNVGLFTIQLFNTADSPTNVYAV